MRRKRATTLAVLVGLASAGPALAQPNVDDATRSSARQLGEEANAAFTAQRWAEALDMYERADALVHVPTLGVRAARCLVQLGRLVEASERYLAVTRMHVAPDALAVHHQAQAQAQSERAALLPRIPALLIELDAPADAQVLLDGQPLPAALVGARRLVDPGPHRVEARARGTSVVRQITVREGEVHPVRLRLEAPGGAPPVGNTRTGGDALSGVGRGEAQRTAGWIGVGAGALGLGVGAVAGALALGKKGDLEAGCGPDLEACSSGAWEDAQGYNTLRTVSGVGFIAGGVVATAGIVLLLTAPPAAAPGETAGVALGASARGLWLRGSF
jgi:hypothetical protein